MYNSRALILAGGFGLRLRPLTISLPKPLLPVDGHAVIEHILEQLDLPQIDDIYVSTGYMGRYVRCFVESHIGRNCKFLEETTPLGTAGPLGLLPESGAPCVVWNGDVLAKLNVCDILNYHRAQDADATVLCIDRTEESQYGTIEITNGRVSTWIEKPRYDRTIAGGIYVLSSQVCKLAQGDSRMDMPDLISQAIQLGLKVLPYKYGGSWTDIGSLETYDDLVRCSSVGVK